MKQSVIYLFILIYTFWGLGAVSVAFSSTSGKGFSIVYSSDERGSITPCG